LRSPLSLVDANSPRKRLSGLMATMKLPSTPPQQTQRKWLLVHEILSPRSSPSPREGPPSGFAEMQCVAKRTSAHEPLVERFAVSPTKSAHMSPDASASRSSFDSHSGYEETTGFNGTVPDEQLTVEEWPTTVPDEQLTVEEWPTTVPDEQLTVDEWPTPSAPPPREQKPYTAIESFVRRLSGVPAHPVQPAQPALPALPAHQEELAGRCARRGLVAWHDGDPHMSSTNRARSGRRESAPAVARALVWADLNGSPSSHPSTAASSRLPGSGSMQPEVSETHVLRQHVQFLERQVKELHEKLAMLDDVEARLAVVEVANSMPRSKSLQPRKLISLGFGRKKAARD
jgi:hypothetical protein